MISAAADQIARYPPLSKDAGSGPAAKERIGWLDAAKGVGILIVILGHALGGILDMNGRHLTPLFREIFLGIYVFHMPVFFLLSGLLVRKRLVRSRGGFLIDLLVSVAYPYFLWSTIQYSAIYAAGSLVNRPVSQFWPAIFNLPFASISQFWFLYVLFLLHLAAWVLVPRIGARNFFIVFAAAKLLVALVSPPVMLRLAMVHGVFYAAGVWLGLEGIERFRRGLSEHWLALLLLVLAGAGAVWLAVSLIVAVQGEPFFQLHSWEITALAWRIAIFPAALVATAAFMTLSVTLPSRPVRILSYVGKRSMTIFVLHVLFIAGARIALNRYGHSIDPWMLLVACFSAGLVGPLAISAVQRRFTTSRALGLG